MPLRCRVLYKRTNGVASQITILTSHSSTTFIKSGYPLPKERRAELYLIDIFIPAPNRVSLETSWNMMNQVVWHETHQVSNSPNFGFLEPWE